MASRSTRNKIRWQSDKAITNVVKIQDHLKYIDELAQGKSEYITTYLPSLVSAMEMAKKVLEKFREGL